MPPGVATTDRLLGQILAERYQILHRLGEGAMGVVYKARHVKVGRLLAVKLLHTRMLADPKVLLRFEREAELAGRLRHPNVIGVVDVGEVDGMRYMVMDFAEGPDLAKLLDEAPMPAERIVRLVRPMLEGLYHAHEQGLIHRDFKPENVIIERDGHGGEVPRIVDFGIALLQDGGDATDRAGRLTTNGLVLGTPHYMAPEQAVADPIDHRIDLFALGIVIYEMLSGRLPFDGSGAEVARANLLLDPPPIRQRVPHLEVDPLLEAFARRLMAKKRSARPATARAARELLDLIERDRGAAARQLGVPAGRSARTAATESVEPQPAPTGAMELDGATVRMKLTPRPVAPAPVATAPSQMTRPAVAGRVRPDEDPGTVVDAVPVRDGAPYAVLYAQSAPAALPGGPHAPAPPVPPAMVRAGAGVAPVLAAYGEARMPPHRDTALRTPLGWQTASLPTRRRSWLVGGLVVGALSIIAAIVLTRTGSDDERRSGEGVAAIAPRPVSAASEPVPTAPEPPAADPAIAAAHDGTLRAAPARDPRGDGTPPAVPAGRPHERNSEPVSRAGHAAAGVDPTPRRIPRASELRAPDAAPTGTGASAPPDPGPRDARPPRSEPPRSEPPRSEPPRADAPPAGLSPRELGALYDDVKAQIEQLPEPGPHRGDLLGQLAMLDILRAIRGSQAVRDDAVAQLWRLRQRLGARGAGR